MNQNTFCKYCHRIPSQCNCTHQAKEQDESFDRTASHMAGEYVSYKAELALTDEEMISIYEKDWSGIKCGLGRAVEQAILRKAQE